MRDEPIFVAGMRDGRKFEAGCGISMGSAEGGKLVNIELLMFFFVRGNGS